MSIIDELRELEAAATPGPWLYHLDALLIGFHDESNGQSTANFVPMDTADAAFIAKFRTHARALLDVAEAARGVGDLIDNGVDAIADDSTPLYDLLDPDAAQLADSLRAALAQLEAQRDTPDAERGPHPTRHEPPRCVFPRWEPTDRLWVCCHGGGNCGGCATYPQACKPAPEKGAKDE